MFFSCRVFGGTVGISNQAVPVVNIRNSKKPWAAAHLWRVCLESSMTGVVEPQRPFSFIKLNAVNITAWLLYSRAQTRYDPVVINFISLCRTEWKADCFFIGYQELTMIINLDWYLDQMGEEKGRHSTEGKSLPGRFKHTEVTDQSKTDNCTI